MSIELTQYPELLYYRTKVAKINADELADKAGMNVATYLRCENGSREFKLSEAKKVADALKVPLHVLFPKIFTPFVA